MDPRRIQILANKNRIEAISTIPPENITLIVLLEYFASADDVHIKYFHRRQSLTTAGLPVKLNSVQLRKQTGGQCLGEIMIQR